MPTEYPDARKSRPEKALVDENVFRAESQLLEGHLKRPVEARIESQALISLNGRGGLLSRYTEGFSAEGLISFQSGRTRVSGTYSERHGWVTVATASLERLNVLDVITADRVVAQVSTELPPLAIVEPGLTFLGTQFENLRICGYPIQMELDLGFFGPTPERNQRYLENPQLLDRIADQVDSLLSSGDLPKVIKEQCRSQLETIGELRKHTNSQPKRMRDRPHQLTCSLVRNIGSIPIPHVRSFGNTLVIPDFGIVSFLQIKVGQRSRESLDLTYFDVTALDVQMGSIAEGMLRVANSQLDGGARPRVATTENRSPSVLYVGPGAPIARESAVGSPPEPPGGAPPQPIPAASPAPSPSPRRKKPPVRQAFPWIVPTNEHVAQRTRFDVEVSLHLTPSTDVEGSATLPAIDETFEIDVHLLLGEESFWQTLQFSWSKQTMKAARFSGVTAPAFRGTAAEPDFRAIRVNFYWNHRWCGEGLKNIEILPHAGIPEAARIPKASVPEWRRWLNVASSDSAPPDLLVRIQEKSTSAYHWSFVSPHADFRDIPAEECEMTLKGGAQSYVKSRFEPLAGISLNTLTMDRLDGTCKHIYQVTPSVFKDVYWRLYRAANENSTVRLDTIQFVTDEPYIPWEIMRVEDEVRAPNIDGEILSVRHSVGRWLAGESCQVRPLIPLQDMAIFASDYSTVDEVATKLKWAEQEAQDLVERYANQPSPKATRYKLVSDEVLKFLKTGKAQVLHFSCHGRMDQESPDHSALMLEDDLTNFTPVVVTNRSIVKGIGTQHPLVFLNACQVGGTGAELSFVTGWPQAFLAMGASAVIAPLWSVGDDSARTIAEEFYKVVISNSPISLGSALQNIRKQFRENKKMTYLAYLLYGDPNTQIAVV